MEIDSPTELRAEYIHGEGATWVDEMIADNHYLGYTPPGARMRIAIFYNKEPVGGMMWGRPVARNEDQETTLELTRFWLAPSCPKNSASYCMARNIDLIQEHLPEIERLISYSDPSVGHDGTVYKASNWNKIGETAGGSWSSAEDRDRPRSGEQSKKFKWEYLLGA